MFVSSGVYVFQTSDLPKKSVLIRCTRVQFLDFTNMVFIKKPSFAEKLGFLVVTLQTPAARG